MKIADVNRSIRASVLVEHPRAREFVLGVGQNSVPVALNEMIANPEQWLNTMTGYLLATFMLGYVTGLLHPEERESIAKGIMVI